MLYATLPSLHLRRATRWVGDLAVMRFAVRTAAAQGLEPPQRRPFMAAAINLGRGMPRFALALVRRVF